ncbi:AMP-binding protein [Bradyrhizobium sp. 2TAF24]|uniref:AMP-binding protein n=1 Tax=Bradyrhizobium sp. 2TAF24 TaxID=3233011 RepID=UPI003F8FE029
MALLPMGALARHHALRKPGDAVALSYPEGELSWQALDARSSRRARLLQARGVKAGDFVTLALPNGLVLYESVFAIWKLGAIPNVVSPRLAPAEAAAILDLVRPAVLIAEAGFGPSDAPRLPPDAALDGFDDAPFEPAPPAPYWKAMTSGGSTGRPKVIVDHMAAVYDPDEPVFGQRVDDIILNAGPLYHNAPFAFAFRGLFCGARVVGTTHFDAEEALRLIARHRVAFTFLVPTMMHRILALPDELRRSLDVSSLRTVVHGASAAPEWLKEQWIGWLGPDVIWDMYGGTESQGFTVINGREWLTHRGSVGRLVTPGELRVLRDDGRVCAPGEIGEIYFMPAGGAGSTYHYLGAEPHRRADGWETLGDLGWLDPEGYLYLADRRTDLILRGGANIYPAEIEAALDAHQAVASSLVIGLPHRDLGQSVHAMIEPRQGRSIDLVDLEAFLADRIAQFKLPQSYEFSAVPLRDHAGKARRQALRTEREQWLTEGREFKLLRPRAAAAAARPS